MIHAYPLDSSALVHLAARNRRFTNTFRLSAALTEDVSPVVLQEALERIAPRFPLIIAGIRRERGKYMVVPADVPSQVQPDREYLAYMPDEMIQSCAMRVLYQEKKLSVEIFHSLTDGYGGLTFMIALLAEYAALACGISVNNESLGPAAAETLTDDFITHAGKQPVSYPYSRVYQFPGGAKSGQTVHAVTGICDLQRVLDAAHSCGVSLTAFLTAVMASSVAELQARYSRAFRYIPIQIMVPVNLRNRFQSVSLRNFSLYALPRIEPEQIWMPVGELARLIGQQLDQQLSSEHLAGMMATNVRLQQSPLVQGLPLGIKEAVLRFGQRFLGDKNSCLSLSNLGEIKIPEELHSLVARMEFTLSPRKTAPYNCGVTSYGGKLYVNFSRRGHTPELEKIFFQQLIQMGIETAVELDGHPTALENLWAENAAPEPPHRPPFKGTKCPYIPKPASRSRGNLLME